MIILYPSYSFETLSTDRTAAEASELLASWTAAFHPALIETFDEIPRWESASIPPYDASEQPILIPPCCESYINEDWFRQQQESGTLLIRDQREKDEILAALFQSREIVDHGFDDAYVADFQALGTTYFLTDLLVRQLHYMSTLDDSQFMNQTFNSLRAYRRGERETAQDHLKQAFEAICQSKEYFYPIRTSFLDLILLTETTLGEAFRTMLHERDQLNLFLPSGLLDAMPGKEPESFDALKSACAAGKVQLIADDTEERSLLLLPLLDVADRILEGLSFYRERLGVSPTVYGRLHVGLTPLLPQLLKLIGMKGALHFAPLDGWKIKEETQSKMIWQGVDGTKFDALVRYPLNGAADLDFFELVSMLGQSINNDQASSAVFAQFPGTRENWLGDLRRMSRFATELGEFTPIEHYFDDTSQCGGVRKSTFASYPGNALSEAVAVGSVDPISYWNDIYRQNVRRLIDSAFETVLTLLGLPESDLPIVDRFANAVTGKPPVSNSASNAAGMLVANPWSFPRRVFLDISDWSVLPEEKTPVLLARKSGARKEIVVEVPPLGYAFVPSPLPLAGAPAPPGTPPPSSPSSSSPGIFGMFKSKKPASEPDLILKTVDEIGRGAKRSIFLLRNEFFEAKIDATTGMLRSILTEKSRFNRLSRQLGFRRPKEQRLDDPRSVSDPNRGYAITAADEISIEQSGPITGRLLVRGRLVLPDGSTAATFRETVTIRRRSRMLEYDLTLQPEIEPGDSPWDSYFAIRYAWNDNTLDLRGCLGDGLHPLSTDRLQSPKIVDLRGEESSLTFFSEGLPFHRRFGERQLDTILIAGGESARNFRFGIGVDLAYPIPASLEFLAGSGIPVVSTLERPKTSSSWLFQIEAKNVVALHWEPIVEEERAVGFRVFLLETEGRRAHFALHSFLEPKKAVSTTFLGEAIKEYKTDGDRVLIDLHGHELLPLSVRFC